MADLRKIQNYNHKTASTLQTMQKIKDLKY